MYEELIAELREEAEWAKANEWETPIMLSDHLTQAADAIEELQKAVYFHKYNSEFWEDKYNSLVDEKWIPVTERLPEDGSLVGKLIADSDGNIRIASQCAEITLNGGKTVYTDLIDLVSFLAEDTPTTEWEDCTHITHWMPLPPAPKEE